MNLLRRLQTAIKKSPGNLRAINNKKLKVYVYILQTNPKGYYTGITKDLIGRLIQHETGKSISTRNKRPLSLIFSTYVFGYKQARQLEKHIKNVGAERFLRHLQHNKSAISKLMYGKENHPNLSSKKLFEKLQQQQQQQNKLKEVKP